MGGTAGVSAREAIRDIFCACLSHICQPSGSGCALQVLCAQLQTASLPKLNIYNESSLSHWFWLTYWNQNEPWADLKYQ